jgi:hypothetical protein
MLARSSIALTRTRRFGEGLARIDRMHHLYDIPSQPDPRMAVGRWPYQEAVLENRTWNRVRECRSRRSGAELVFPSVLPFLLLCQTGRRRRRRVMGKERVMGRERQERETRD